MMKVGLMGLGEGGHLVAEALFSSSWCKLVAVASRKSHRIDRFVEKHPDIVAYDDYRSLIVENPLDALFVALPPFLRGKYLALAAEHGCPVWMITPVARRFDEAVEIMERFDKARCPVAVGREVGASSRPCSLTPSTWTGLAVSSSPAATLTTCGEEDLDWRGDSVRAGGGVLLDRGYELVDTVVKVMGLPATVYAAAKGVSRPGTRFPYDTEDTAAIVCQFSSGAVAAINACWTSGPERCEIEFFGTGGSIRIDPRHVVCRDRTGEKILADLPRATNPLLGLRRAFPVFLEEQSGADPHVRPGPSGHHGGHPGGIPVGPYRPAGESGGHLRHARRQGAAGQDFVGGVAPVDAAGSRHRVCLEPGYNNRSAGAAMESEPIGDLCVPLPNRSANMSKRWLVCVATGIGMVAGVAIAQYAAGERRETEGSGQVPPKVRAAITKHAKGGKVEIEGENEAGVVVYKADWKHLTRESQVVVTSDGDLVSLTEQIDAREVPPSVIEAAKARFPNQNNLVFVRRTAMTFEAQAMIEGKRQALAISPLGKPGETRDRGC